MYPWPCIYNRRFKKVENADVFIENGLGLETFNQKILDTYPDVDIIEASKGVLDNQKDGDEINAHIWTNLDNYIQQVKNVSSKLQELDSKHKDEYSKNEDEYVKKLEDLKNEYKDKLAKVSGKKALVLDETLPHLCTYTKLDKVEIKTDHEQESLSSDDLKNVITDMKSNNTKIILVAKNSDKQNAEMISKETGAKIYELNSCMVGDVNENAYIDYMKENFDIISEIE